MYVHYVTFKWKFKCSIIMKVFPAQKKLVCSLANWGHWFQKLVSLPFLWRISSCIIVKCQNLKFREKSLLWFYRNWQQNHSSLSGPSKSAVIVLTKSDEVTTDMVFSPALSHLKLSACYNECELECLLTLGLLSFGFLGLCGGRSELVLAWDCWEKPWETGSGRRK